MTRRPVHLTDAAANEAYAAAEWYQHRRSGLGLAFALELRRLLARIAAFPDSYPHVNPKCRKALLRRFPYLLVYEVAVDRIIVIAIFHAAIDPLTVADLLRQ